MEALNPSSPRRQGRSGAVDSPAETEPVLNAVDRQLLNLLQTDFPLVPRPFALLGQKVGLSEEDVVEKVRSWQKSGLVRRLGPVFDSRRLGFKGMLCAMAVPPEEVEAVAGYVNRLPGITHNYVRESWRARQESAGAKAYPAARYNLWFTIIAPTQQEAEAQLAAIAAHTGITDYMALPASKLFKIRVQFAVEEPSTGGQEA